MSPKPLLNAVTALAALGFAILAFAATARGDPASAGPTYYYANR